MADVHTPQQRRYNMQQIRAKNTKPELLVRKFYMQMGFVTHSIIKNYPASQTLF